MKWVLVCNVCKAVIEEEDKAEEHVRSHPLSVYFQPVPVVEWKKAKK